MLSTFCHHHRKHCESCHQRLLHSLHSFLEVAWRITDKELDPPLVQSLVSLSSKLVRRKEKKILLNTNRTFYPHGLPRICWGSPWGRNVLFVFNKIFFLRSFLVANDVLIEQKRLLVRRRKSAIDFDTLKNWKNVLHVCQQEQLPK